MMIKDVESESGGYESDAAGAFLAELRRGPFAPALVSSILDHYGVTMKLTEFLHKNLDDQVVAIFNQAKSPVGRPALCLRTQIHNPAYWRGEEGFVGYRLSALAASAWEEGRRNLDMSVLDDGNTTFLRNDARPCTSDMTITDFLRVFKVGARFSGKVERRAHGAQGWIVTCEAEGQEYRCFLPDAEIDQAFAHPGLVGVFEVISTLPQKKSVLLRFVGVDDAQEMVALIHKVDDNADSDSLVKQLKDSAAFLAAHGVLTASEHATIRNRIFDKI